MGLYKHKDFLTIDDVADYLRDKGIYNFDLYEYQDRCKLSDLIWSLIFSYKITPVFHYAGFAYDLSDESNREFLINKSEYKETLIFSESMINNWQDGQVIKLDGVIKNNNSGFYQSAPINDMQLQEIFNQKLRTDDFYKYKSFKNHKDYVLDISNYTTSIGLLVPRIEFDNIFIQPTTQQLSPNINYLNEATRDLQTKDEQITTLQQQLQEAQARIKELESKQDKNTQTTTNSHTNTALIALNEVIATHWQDPNNPPKQQFIIAWIIENYPSIESSKALWIDKIIRHKDK